MKNRVIFILGPTASGKTEISVKLAKSVNGEIISCDSMQVYKDMPVLTQAPSEKNLKEIPHYLIAELPPDREYSAAEFSKRASGLIKDMIKRKKTPVVAGGTGLYAKALIDGLFPSPKKNLFLRKKLELKIEKFGSMGLYNELKNLDPEGARNIHPNDAKRIIRALEIYHSTGTPLSEHKKNTKGIKDEYEIIELGLVSPRQNIYENINKRVEKMFRGGVVPEVKELLKRRLSVTAKSAIGIKEIGRYLKGEINLEEAKELIKKNTRRYAKRQLTWFRADKRIKWFNDGKDLISYCRSGK